MRWISTTIKRKWLDKILSGEKEQEYKGATEFWNKRLTKILECGEEIGINFLCGRESYKFEVMDINHYYGMREIDGTEYESFYEIRLGKPILASRTEMMKLGDD